ncbi:Plant invertase/pectin methylesterase inhibitor superfamily protein [Raphanus sativus]|uniref:Pectinesterase inhibitor 12-like n=1 Tax=Raphanus sativus TaxID=3726 RepID=A0A6J0LVY5_RAPSA|nr:pectinesterase inhibitor 12-like [Raphanus sativus]KAJ4901441.1 Plant invertase/pectin methylesterase inhibitor superfamily protein [Raphanus sativus]
MLMYTVVFVLLFNGCMANKVADSLIQKSCKNISVSIIVETIPHFEKDCIASFKENPESQKARNVDDLIMLGANNALSYLMNVKGIVEKIIKEKKYKSSLSKKSLEDCLQLYSKSAHMLTSGLKYLKKRNFEKAQYEIIDADEAPIFCELKFNGDNKQISPVKKENNLLLTMIYVPYCLLDL